jgi:hypothetical protein
MRKPSERPFLVDGDPFRATAFIVGANPATDLSHFWSFWDDERGMDRKRFMIEYRATRALKGVRPRIERIVARCPSKVVLETNVFSKPTARDVDLEAIDRRTVVFEHIFRQLRPNVLFMHSNKPIEYMERETGQSFRDMQPLRVTWKNHSFTAVARRGPLWRASYKEAEAIGELIDIL